MPKRSKKGAILFIVLGVIMVVMLLSTIILRIISSQSRITQHQVGRIQAYYAAKAGMLYALDRLRLGTWSFVPNSCPNPAGCVVADPDFPPVINIVRVIFCPQGTTCVGSSTPCNPPAGTNFCINTFVDYTYSP